MKRLNTLQILLTIVMSIGLTSACKKQPQPDCIPSTDAPIDAEVVRTPVPVDYSKSDWCRICVMSKNNFASCQRVHALDKNESRESIKKRARDKACKDAGFEINACPDSAIIGAACKGDASPASAPAAGKALQKMFYGKKEQKKPEESKAEKSTAKEQKAEKPKAPKPI